MNTNEQEQMTPSTQPDEPETQPEETTPEAAEPSQNDVTARLAADFLLLAEEFSDLQSPAQLPDTVLDVAAREGIPLLDAYLRYRWQEEKRVLAAARQQEQAARQSAGSLAAGTAQAPPEQDAFLRAFRRAL